uniref:Murine leukemia virus integrase C-terminal domain-containing protein n=1 Tax=Naja naja TaxID=35670 RepID=A0A8C6XSA6_NAJNA
TLLPWPKEDTWVRVKELFPSATSAKWSNPRQVLLSTPTAAKVEGIKAWVYVSRIKIPPPQWECQYITDLKLCLQQTPASPADLFDDLES